VIPSLKDIDKGFSGLSHLKPGEGSDIKGREAKLTGNRRSKGADSSSDTTGEQNTRSKSKRKSFSNDNEDDDDDESGDDENDSGDGSGDEDFIPDLENDEKFQLMDYEE